MMIRLMITVIAVSAAYAPLMSAEAPSDIDTWNEGVEFYRAGDYTNALRVLKPLQLSKTHGARAAEVVAKIEFDNGNREEAADAAQIALRSSPKGDRENRNFTRATDGLAAWREQNHINEVLKSAQGKDPGSMLIGAMHESRALLEAAGNYRTNVAERAVALADRLSERTKKLADVWIPVREVVSSSVTNAEQAATINSQVSAAEEKTKKAAKELADFNPEAYGDLAASEYDFTRFAYLTANPPAAIAEDLVSQSNAWQDVTAVNGRPWQPDALEWTRAFRRQFPAWARAYEQQAQSDTNKPPFTAEAQAKISSLATELEKLQLECVENDLPPKQEEALGIIREIQELLPKDGSSQSGQQGQPQQNQQQNQDQQKQNQNQDQQQNQQDQDFNQGEEPPQDENQNEESEGESEEEQEVEAVLKKAQERSDEHEAEKKARARKIPLPPNERDW